METNYLIEGFTGTFVLVISSLIIPLVIGIVLTICGTKNSTVEKVFSWISLPFECLCPLILFYIIYFTVPIYLGIYTTSFLCCISTLSVCFIGYMPSRINQNYSVLKNILYYGLGLLRNIFFWSFTSSVIGYLDLFKAAQMVTATTYKMEFCFIPFVFSFGFVMVIEVARRIVKQCMK